MKKRILFFWGLWMTILHGYSQWNAQTSGTKQILHSIFFISPTQGWTVGADGTILTTTNGGSTWSELTSGTGSSYLESVFFISSTQGWAVGDSGVVLKTNNGGSSWSKQITDTNSALSSVFFTSSTQGWAVGSSFPVGSGRLLHTTDGGTTWLVQTTTSTDDFTSVYFVSPTQGWIAGGSGTILVTTNGGSTWNSQTTGTTSGLNSIYFVNSTHGWAVGSNGTIISTTDGGNTWNSQSSGNTNYNITSVNFISVLNGWAVVNYSAGFGVILTTVNGGSNWTVQLAGTTAGLNSIYFTSATEGWAVGINGTILHTSDGGIQSVQEFSPKSPISVISPNPFSTSSTIKFSVTSPSLVKLELFDVSGRMISSLVNEIKAVGDYNVPLNNEGYSTGMYFYRLQVGDAIETKKIIIQ